MSIIYFIEVFSNEVIFFIAALLLPKCNAFIIRFLCFIPRTFSGLFGESKYPILGCWPIFDLSLPADDIVVVHRSDGSGTTFIWTDYLSHVSQEWNQTVGAGKSVQWTVGLGAQGNEGVSNTILSTPNSIGYVELTYALTTDMDYASFMNSAGNFVEPTIASTQAAAQRRFMNSYRSFQSTSLQLHHH